MGRKLLMCLIITLFFGVMVHFNMGTCDNFMSVLSTRQPWSSTNESCAPIFYELDDQIRILSTQMYTLDSTLTIFTNYPITNLCTVNYPNIIIKTFDALDLLREYGFKNELKIMRSWGDVGYARTSDILRLLLALKYKKAYVDFDIHFLKTTRSIFMKQFVGAAMWDDKKNAIEITNSAFCLHSDALEDLIKFAKDRIMRNNNTYFYTELGPSMFHKVLMNKHPVTLLSKNHPQHASLDIIAGDT